MNTNVTRYRTIVPPSRNRHAQVISIPRPNPLGRFHVQNEAQLQAIYKKGFNRFPAEK